MKINSLTNPNKTIMPMEFKKHDEEKNPFNLKLSLKFEIKDEITISKEGNELSQASEDRNMLKPENIKVWENNMDDLLRDQSSDEQIDDLFIDATLTYKKELMALKNTNSSDYKIKRLEKAYLENIESSIDRIASKLNSYFDKGRYLSNAYSKEPLVDLFDENLFKDNLKKSVLDMRAYIMETDTPTKEEFQDKLVDGPKTTSLEKISYADLKVLYNFVTEPPKFGDSIDNYDINSAHKIANKEKESNHQIGALNLTDDVKAAMYEVNRRVSDGMLKHVAFKEETNMYIYDMQQYDKKLQHLLERLKKINEIIENAEENGGINAKNELLLRYLGKKESTTESYNQIKKEKDDREMTFSSLNSNKYMITEKDTYKRVKAEYDQEMTKS